MCVRANGDPPRSISSASKIYASRISIDESQIEREKKQSDTLIHTHININISTNTNTKNINININISPTNTIHAIATMAIPQPKDLRNGQVMKSAGDHQLLLQRHSAGACVVLSRTCAG